MPGRDVRAKAHGVGQPTSPARAGCSSPRARGRAKPDGVPTSSLVPPKPRGAAACDRGGEPRPGGAEALPEDCCRHDYPKPVVVVAVRRVVVVAVGGAEVGIVVVERTAAQHPGAVVRLPPTPARARVRQLRAEGSMPLLFPPSSAGRSLSAASLQASDRSRRSDRKRSQTA